ncbi:hypothetical protein [Pseudomonas batumici]
MIKRIAQTARFTGFLAASQLINAAFWLALGLISAWLFRRQTDEHYSA